MPYLVSFNFAVTKGLESLIVAFISVTLVTLTWQNSSYPWDSSHALIQPEPPVQPPPTLPTVIAISVKIPPFWPADPLLWFAQVEAQFNTWNVTNEWFDYVVTSLTPEFSLEVRDLIHAPRNQPYDGTQHHPSLVQLLSITPAHGS